MIDKSWISIKSKILCNKSWNN